MHATTWDCHAASESNRLCLLPNDQPRRSKGSAVFAAGVTSLCGRTSENSTGSHGVKAWAGLRSMTLREYVEQRPICENCLRVAVENYGWPSPGGRSNSTVTTEV